MLNSKALKSFDEDDDNKWRPPWDRPDTWSWKVLYWFRDLTWKLFWNHYYFLKKWIAWGKLLHNGDFDFDAKSLYPILNFKLKRVEKALIKGWAIQEDKDMQALRLAIKLSHRLSSEESFENDPYWKWHLRHDAKWGDSITDWKPSRKDENGKTLTWEMLMSRPKANTPELKEQERTEYMEGIKRSDAIKERDKKNLFKILANHIDVWWD